MKDEGGRGSGLIRTICNDYENETCGSYSGSAVCLLGGPAKRNGDQHLDRVGRSAVLRWTVLLGGRLLLGVGTRALVKKPWRMDSWPLRTDWRVPSRTRARASPPQAPR